MKEMNNEKKISKPPYGRTESFDLIFEFLSFKKNMQFLEIGMTKNSKTENINGEGYSTPYISWVAYKTNSKFTSIDIEEVCKFICERILRSFNLLNDNIELITADALEYLKGWDKNIDFIYLDAWDYTKGNEESSAMNHLKVFQLIEKWLNKDAYILIDDIINHDTYEGKGKYLIPYLLKNNYELVYSGYQYLFKKDYE